MEKDFRFLIYKSEEEEVAVNAVRRLFMADLQNIIFSFITRQIQK